MQRSSASIRAGSRLRSGQVSEQGETNWIPVQRPCDLRDHAHVRCDGSANEILPYVGRVAVWQVHPDHAGAEVALHTLQVGIDAFEAVVVAFTFHGVRESEKAVGHGLRTPPILSCHIRWLKGAIE